MQGAIATTQRIPPAVKLRLEQRSDYYSELALIDYKMNRTAAGDQALQRALQLSRTSDTPDALAARLQVAAAFMEQGKTLLAIEIYQQATEAHPDDPSGWEALVGAYTREGHFSQAITAVRSMPQSAYQAAIKNAGFLNSVALIYSARGQCSEAEHVLQRSISLERASGRPPSEGTQLQLADVLMRRHRYDTAEDVYYDIVGRDANSADAWRGYLAVLHRRRADQTLVSELPRVPASVRTQLETDPSFLILEASAYSTVGRNQDALPLLVKARSRFAAQHKQPPVDLDLQTAWTMLTVSPGEPGLSDLLQSTKSRSGLDYKQRQAIQELSSLWSVRRAELLAESKPQEALSILTDAAREYPLDRNIHVALASLYLKRDDKQKALDVFQTWGMTGAQAGDYRIAAGAALSAHKNQLAEQFLERGLRRFPTDPQLMHMKARQDIARGDYEQGERELKSAMLALRDGATSGAQTKPVPSTDQQHAGAALVNQENAAAASGASESGPPCSPEPDSSTVGEASIRPMALVLVVPHRHMRYQVRDQVQNTQSATTPAPPPRVQQQQEAQQIQQESEAVTDRNTPLINVGGVGAGRLGDPGIDQLILGETLLGGAYTASNQVRFGIQANGVYAYSGTPDGSSTLKYGTLPAGATFAQQDQFGYGGFAEISTNTFGLMGGTSPQGFPVHNLIGGIRFRPFNGPFTFLGLRDSVKDSLLSYAGARDPLTGIRWGGVVSNTATVKFDSAPSNGSVYKRFGEYASASYSLIQGRHVPDNWRGAANAGFYWQMVQGLTVGVNAAGMHYQKNLKYFSFGQGGYFSPQEYYLASIPISWYSRHPRFEYAIRFSGGVQYLNESATPYYPVLPGSTPVKQGTYAANHSAAPNYDADIRLGYRMTPHVYLGTFATANNAENYYSQSAGFTLRFLINPIPTSTDLRVNSIPDWTGQQPFAVQ